MGSPLRLHPAPPLHATSRVSESPPGAAVRLGLLAAVLLALAEGLCRALVSGAVDPAALGPLASPTLDGLDAYWRARGWTLAHPWTVALGTAVGALTLLVAARQGLLLWSRLKARVTGTAFRESVLSFPMRRVDLLRELRAARRATPSSGSRPAEASSAGAGGRCTSPPGSGRRTVTSSGRRGAGRRRACCGPGCSRTPWMARVSWSCPPRAPTRKSGR